MHSNGKSNDSFAAAVLGALVGASAVTLAHKPIRTKVKKALQDAFNDVEDKAEDTKRKVTKGAVKQLKKAERNLSQV